MGKNLWGNLDELTKGIKLPKEILEEQAEYLKQGFAGLVRGRVQSVKLTDSWKSFYDGLHVMSDFAFSFTIFSDYIERYQYQICTVVYGIKVYPVAISFGPGIAEEVNQVFDVVDGDTIIASDEEFLLSVLERILSSVEVHQVLGGLVSMAQKEKESGDVPF